MQPTVPSVPFVLITTESMPSLTRAAAKRPTHVLHERLSSVVSLTRHPIVCVEDSDDGIAYRACLNGLPLLRDEFQPSDDMRNAVLVTKIIERLDHEATHSRPVIVIACQESIRLIYRLLTGKEAPANIQDLMGITVYPNRSELTMAKLK